jgi:hypothetical protein
LKDVVFEPVDRTRTSQFSVFKATATDGQTDYLVFANKSTGEVLLPEVGNFDFLFQVIGRNDDEFIDNCLEEIRNFPEVLLTAEIPLKKVRNKERLVYEEEKPARKLISPKRFNK